MRLVGQPDDGGVQPRRVGFSAPYAEFSPTLISGLELWLDASQITGLANADPVTSWSDLSGNARHATQATPASQPTYRTDSAAGFPGVRFDGSNDYLDTPSFALSQPVTVFIAVNLTSPIAGNDAYLSGINATRIQWYRDGGVEKMFTNSGGSINCARRAYDRVTLCYRADGASSDLHINGAFKTTGNPGTTGFSDGLRVGWDNSFAGGYALLGDLYEITVYSTRLSNDDMDRMGRYLAAKWGLPAWTEV